MGRRKRPIETILACVRCGREWGPFGTQAYPQRLAGQPYGYDGEICLTCYRSVRRERRGEKDPRINLRLAELARHVFNFSRALDSGTPEEQAQQYERMLALAAASTYDAQCEQRDRKRAERQAQLAVS